MELQSGLVRIASYKLPRKKNIYLPTEVWVDVFCFPWTTRPKLAQMVDKIGNRWFGEQLQFYLHEWGKHTLGYLFFKPKGVMKCHNSRLKPLEYPHTAMPENIKFCNTFHIEYFDNRVFNFFRRIQSVRTTDARLEVLYFSDEQLNNARTILGHLLPFIDGIHTMRTNYQMLPVVQSFSPEKFHQIKVFNVYLNRLAQSAMQPIMEWLTTSISNEPKLLQLHCNEHEIFQQALKTIRKQFMEATEPSTFAVIFRFNPELLNFHSENGIGEQLYGTGNGNVYFEVFRHQANAEVGDQLRQWVDGNADNDGLFNRKPCISLLSKSIGNERIFAMPDLDEEKADDKKEDEDEKPSTSKKRRICK